MHIILRGMTTSLIVGIVILVLNVLIVAGVVTYFVMKWKSSRPKKTIRDVGVRFLKGSDDPWTGMECTISKLYDIIGAAYGDDFAKQFMSRIIIEVVPHDGSRRTPTTVVSEASKIAGSIDSEKKFPWSKPYHVAVVLQRKDYTTTGRSAIAHEIIKHILPIYRNEGTNADHSRKDLDALSNEVDVACR